MGSNTDTGHTGNGGSGAFALNPDNSLNWGLIRDFAFNGIHLQAVWSKNLTKMYYGMDAKIHILERLLDRWSPRSSTGAKIS